MIKVQHSLLSKLFQIISFFAACIILFILIKFLYRDSLTIWLFPDNKSTAMLKFQPVDTKDIAFSRDAGLKNNGCLPESALSLQRKKQLSQLSRLFNNALEKTGQLECNSYKVCFYYQMRRCTSFWVCNIINII